MFVWLLFLSLLALGHCDDSPNLLPSNESRTDSTANDFQSLIDSIALLIKKVKQSYEGSFQMIPRSEWGAGPSSCNTQLRTPAPYLIIHHIPGQECHEKSTCQQVVKGLQELHIKMNGWCDVAYNFLIGNDGNVYEGVGWAIQGTHTVGYNDQSLGVAFVGSVAGSSPSAAALAAAQNLTSFAVFRDYLSYNYIQPLLVQSESCLVPQRSTVAKKKCPGIISRSSWGARETYCAKLLQPAKYVIIIHTAGRGCNVTEECKITVQNIQSFHMDKMDFCDIGYNFLVGEDGRVYEGVGWDTEGSHTYGYNDIALGIAFIGLFTGTPPNAAALKVAQDLIQCAVDRGYLIPDYLLVGHSDVVNTLSPGQALYDKIKTWPHFKH